MTKGLFANRMVFPDELLHAPAEADQSGGLRTCGVHVEEPGTVWQRDV